ncbi:MAG: hypothetical protein IPK32_24545 [Verrucomicrobiaceae bacterium]|nr:hypothetical protein [Verrucomicrobiaceae bacterium]
MSAKKKSIEKKVESAPSPPLAGDCAAIPQASKVAAERAFYEYLTLPDADAIVSRMRPAVSASEALQVIQDGKNEAWRIRVEMVQTWDSHTMGAVWAMVDTKVGKLPDGVRRIHPVVGPLLSVYYDEMLPKHQDKIRPAIAAWEAQELAEQEAKKAARIARKPARSKGGKNATESRESTLLIRCVNDYVRWVMDNSQLISLTSTNQFPKPKRITRSRIDELLRTLINALGTPSLKDGLCERLKQHGFPNATEKAVAECMAVLEKGTLE